MNRHQKAFDYWEEERAKGDCFHASAGGSFIYKGEGPGAIRTCIVCGLKEECFNPNPIDAPHYVQWRKCITSHCTWIRKAASFCNKLKKIVCLSCR